MAKLPRQTLEIRREHLDHPARLTAQTVGLTECNSCLDGQGSVVKSGTDLGSLLPRGHSVGNTALHTMKVALVNQRQYEPGAIPCRARQLFRFTKIVQN